MNKRWFLIGLCFLLVFLVPIFVIPTRSMAQSGDPYALIDTVNALRAANGLYPYQTNSALMIAAQGQSDYQAALGYWTHEGLGGTDETYRALAAGYGGGASIKCDENVAWGNNLTAQGCVGMWMDAIHLANMLSSRFVDVGAGASVDVNGNIFYTLDVCYVVGGVLPPTSSVGAGTPWPTLEPFYKVNTVTPGPDGEIIHTIKAGQSLISISQAYSITLTTLLELNGLNKDSLIHPDDQLIIRPSFTPGPTREDTPTPTRILSTSTQRPTRTPTQTAQPKPSELAQPFESTPTSVSPPISLFDSQSTDQLILGLTIILAATGLVFAATGIFLRTNR
jgi:LysM repeat protein